MDNVTRLASEYSTSKMLKHALIENLFCDDLLLRVKDEGLNASCVCGVNKEQGKTV